MLFDGEPLIICAELRADSPALPQSIIRECEGCGVEVMTAPSSAPMIEAGGHPCCLPCGMVAQVLLGGGNEDFMLVPGSLDEVARILGPKAASEAEALVESLNRARRRVDN
jgi:hypothetical protein